MITPCYMPNYGIMFYWAIFSPHSTLPQLLSPFHQGTSLIGLDDPNLDPVLIPDAITRRDIVVIEGKEVQATPGDLLLLYLLTQPGCRWDGPPLGQTLSQCYISWPTIPITVLAHRAPPAAPIAAVVSNASIIAFINRLASHRAEWDSSLKGLYIATELFSTRMQLHEGRWYPLRPTLNAKDPRVPAPMDYNFMLRLLKLYPIRDDGAKAETQAYVSATNVGRINAVTMYGATLTIGATTVLYDLNIRPFISFGIK